MNLILTHENADFDALASQLAAHRLMPDCVPLLPRNLHRNARHFVSLYWDELPFIESADLPREPVRKIVVVDTQNPQTVRGMNKRTAVQVIDHHTSREPLNSEWDVTVEAVGATTTILVERLREIGCNLTPIEATLLVLGIYEDTGSLGYGATTARDVYAAGWLIDQGAMLDVVAQFLHHPLADDQKALYEQLLENAATYPIEGYPVVIAEAAAPGMVEEIATLAHRLRDTLEPAAIFLLVDLGSHVQMVARSTTDAIDVGQIAERFGGGGHGRASAAILRNMTFDQIRTGLLDALDSTVRAGVTVADLMSRGVQMVSPTTRADEANRRMRRYGHEGYPVVSDEGQIVGLLTRRAVDRAIDHGLEGVRAERIMDAGSVSVSPSDSISTLQQVMMSSGWGQVPVVDARQQVIGVVTRTDLIKQMHLPNGAPSGRADMIRRLEAALPPLQMALVREIGAEAHRLGLNLYVVGGFVRDLLLDQPTTDFDFVVEGDAISLTRSLRRRFGGEVRSHDRFGTGKWLVNASTWGAIAAQLDIDPEQPEHYPPHIDFVTARSEFYPEPTALPEVERSSIKLDLHRRDFTINTLALRLDSQGFGQLLDFWGGQRDLREKRIRVLHSISFIDDPTRILRAVRLEQRLGFHIEPRTAELLEHALPMLDRVSGDRIRHEIEFILEEPVPERALCRLDEMGILKAVHPELNCNPWVSGAFARLREAANLPAWPELNGLDLALPYFHLLTYRIPGTEIPGLCRRLRVRRRTMDDLNEVQRLRDRIADLNASSLPSEVDAILDGANDRVLLSAWAAASDDAVRAHITAYARAYRRVRPRTDGHKLKEKGLKPGPQFKQILDALRRARLDGEISTEAQEAALLEELLERAG